MHARSMPNMRDEAIEEQLHILWRTLPLRGVTDHEGTLEDYRFALGSCSVVAVENTVNALRAGIIEDASKDFCPKAPKLAEYARAEQHRLDVMSRPKLVSHQPITRPWKDWNIIQRERTRELASEGFVLIAENATQEQACNAARAKRWPVGTIWFWAIMEAWGPA